RCCRFGKSRRKWRVKRRKTPNIISCSTAWERSCLNPPTHGETQTRSSRGDETDLRSASEYRLPALSRENRGGRNHPGERFTQRGHCARWYDLWHRAFERQPTAPWRQWRSLCHRQRSSRQNRRYRIGALDLKPPSRASSPKAKSAPTIWVVKIPRSTWPKPSPSTLREKATHETREFTRN